MQIQEHHHQLIEKHAKIPQMQGQKAENFGSSSKSFTAYKPIIGIVHLLTISKCISDSECGKLCFKLIGYFKDTN